jgi:hypothetical protein
MRAAVRWLLALGFLGGCACNAVPSYASSSFEGDDEGWTVTGNADATRPTFISTGGNPGPHLCATDALPNDLYYFVAPARYLGNVATAVFGKRLTFDLKTSSQFNLIRGRDVVLNGGGLAVVQNFRTLPGQDWTPYSFRLDAEASGWTAEDETSRGEPATEEQLRTVLRNLTSMRIRGEFVDGPQDTTCLDNVYFGTP